MHSCPTARTAARLIPEGMTIFCLVSFTTGAVRSAMPATAGFLVVIGCHIHVNIYRISWPAHTSSDMILRCFILERCEEISLWFYRQVHIWQRSCQKQYTKHTITTKNLWLSNPNREQSKFNQIPIFSFQIKLLSAQIQSWKPTSRDLNPVAIWLCPSRIAWHCGWHLGCLQKVS